MSNDPNLDPSRHLVRIDGSSIIEPFPSVAVGDKLPESDGLAAFWAVLVRRRRMWIGVALGLTALVVVVSFIMTPVYESMARIEVETETPQPASDMYERSDADETTIQTQIQMISGPTIAWKTIQQLNLAASLGVLPASKQTPADIETHQLKLIKQFQKKLNVQIVPKTHLLTVGYIDPSPQLSQKVTAAVVDNYLDENFREKYDAIRRSGWLDQQLGELKGKVEKSQQDLIQYERDHDITTTGDKEDVVNQMLSDSGRTLTSANADRIQKESLYRQVLANRSQAASLANDELLQKLEEKLSELKQQHAEIVAQYGPSFPRATRVQLQIADQQAQVEQEENRVIDRIQNDYTTSLAREKLAQNAVASGKEQVGRLNQLLVQDNLLRREFESNQQLYQSLLGRLKEASVTAGLRSTSIHLVDAPILPTSPLRPQPVFWGAIALLAGIVLGGMAAFAQDKMDPSIRTVEDAEELSSVPVLCGIPLDASLERSKIFSRKKVGHSAALTLTERPKSTMSEAFRALGTAILSPSSQPKTLLITSAQDGEGKTVTTVNLGQALAQRKGPILIMDCDLRRGNIAAALNLPNEKGVSTVLSGEHDISEALQQYGAKSNLWVLTSGPVALQPAELLASEKMQALLKTLSSRFACVLIDSPPVLAVTDAVILASHTDRVLLVAASGSTTRMALLRTRRILTNAGGRVLGVTVNKLDRRSQYYREYVYSRSA